MITKKQKELLEKELKEIDLSYVMGFVISLIVALIFSWVLRSISELPLFGLEAFLSGFWFIIWILLAFLMTFYKWIKTNRLTERKKETQLRLAEKVVD